MFSLRALALVGASVVFIGVPRWHHQQFALTSVGAMPGGGELRPCIYAENDRSGRPGSFCPAGYAFFGVDDPAGVTGPAAAISATGSCCPLPSADVLTSEHTFSIDQCPDDSVATGSVADVHGGRTTQLLRCTKINTERYALAPAAPAKYWGDGAAGWLGADEIAWKDIPAGIRYAQGWWGGKHRDIDGCIGYPWGSLLTGKTTKFCSGFTFRQLLFRGAVNDPVAGTPVKMFPDCADLAHENDPSHVECLHNEEHLPPVRLASTSEDGR